MEITSPFQVLLHIMEITRTLPTMQVQIYNQDTNQVAEAVKIIVDKKIGTVADYT